MYWIVRRTYSWNVRTRKTYLLTRRMCSHDVRTRTARTYVLVWYCWNRTCADVTMSQCSIHEVAFPALVTILTNQVVSTVLPKYTHTKQELAQITHILNRATCIVLHSRTADISCKVCVIFTNRHVRVLLHLLNIWIYPYYPICATLPYYPACDTFPNEISNRFN